MQRVCACKALPSVFLKPGDDGGGLQNSTRQLRLYFVFFEEGSSEILVFCSPF